MDSDDRPEYDKRRTSTRERKELARAFAEQIVLTSAPWVDKPAREWEVLDVGCGYGDTSVELGSRVASVLGCESSIALFEEAVKARNRAAVDNVEFVQADIVELALDRQFDVVVLDNVYEHLRDHEAALSAIRRLVKPEGAVFILVPNKWWPIEAHYRLPFLAWLPLSWADRYLRTTGRGISYEDASYAPSFGSLKETLRRMGFSAHFVLPGRKDATMAGSPLHYRVGMRAIATWPALWRLSKAFLVIAKPICLTNPQSNPSENADSRSCRE